MNRSYYCRLCDRGFNTQDAQHHNCEGQNCNSCTRTNKTCPNFATWIKPTLYCPDCNVMFYGQNCFEAHKAKGPKRTDQSVCDSWKIKCPLGCAHYPFNPKKPHKCYHVSCTNCGGFKHVNNRWYIQPIVEKEPQEQEEQDPSEEPLQWQCEDDDNENENSAPPHHALS